MHKKSFKIFLDSNNTASWTGVLYKANYYINLTKIIQVNEDFFKSYYMYCSFVSQADSINTNNIDPNNVYTLHIDMGKGLNVFQYNSIRTPSFILPVQEFNADTRFMLQELEQMPTVIPNILNVNIIQIQVLNTTTNAITTSNANYVCVLTFVEV
jgi:hypothetical protein